MSYNPLPQNLLVDGRSFCGQMLRTAGSTVNRRRRNLHVEPIDEGKSQSSTTLTNAASIENRDVAISVIEEKTVISDSGDNVVSMSPVRTAGNRRRSSKAPDEDDTKHIHQLPLNPLYQQLSMSTAEIWREDAQAKLTISLALLEFDEAGNRIEVQDEDEDDGLEEAMKDEHIRIVYGNFQEEIGVIRIHGGTTYEQAKTLIRPLIETYMGAVDSSTPSMQELLNNFTFINKRGEVLAGTSLKSRCVLPDVIKNQHTLIVRPGNWISLPETFEEPTTGIFETI